MSIKRIIVTGGAGFIGAHLVDRLIGEDFSVTSLDNLLTGCVENLNPKAEFIQGSVSELNDIEKLPFKDVHAVIHLAAQSSGEASFEDPYKDFNTNVGGTLLLLEWCMRHGIKRFIFTSSMSVYGTSSDEALTEDIPCNPISFYGAGKLSAENYVRLFSGFGLETTILRLFNVYGSKQNLNNLKQGMASIYLAYLLKRQPILVKGSLERFRDQTHVSDVIDAIMLCLEKPVSVGKIYNIATGRKTTVRELIETMLRISGNSFEGYPVKVVEGTKGDIWGCYADVSKATRELGWHCRHTLESGLSEMYSFFNRRISNG